MSFRWSKACIVSFIFAIAVGFQAVEASTKSLGMGNVGVAYPQDAEAGFLNPAGMIDVGDRIDTGVLGFYQSGKTQIKGNAVPSLNRSYDPFRGMRWYPGGGFGINKMICPQSLGIDLGFDLPEMSVGFVQGSKFLPLKTSYRKPFPLIGTKKFGGELVSIIMSPMFAVRLWECHSFGVAFNFLAHRAKTTGLQNLDNPILSQYPGSVTNRGYDYSYGYGVSIGWKSQLTPWLAFGLRYDSMNCNGRFHKYRGYIGDRGLANDPPRYAIGTALKMCPEATIAFDAEYVQFKKVRAFSNPSIPNIETSKLGRKNGAAFGFRNFWLFHLGADYKFDCNLTVRAGWFHNMVPYKPLYNLANTIDSIVVKDTLTVGATWKWNECFDLSFAYLHGFRHTQKGKNSILPALGGGECNLTQSYDIINLGLGFYY